MSSKGLGYSVHRLHRIMVCDLEDGLKLRVDSILTPMAYGLWFRFMAYGLWFMANGLWFMAYGLGLCDLVADLKLLVDSRQRRVIIPIHLNNQCVQLPDIERQPLPE